MTEAGAEEAAVLGPKERYSLDVEPDFGGVLDSKTPERDMIDLVNRTALDKLIYCVQIFGHLVRRADDIHSVLGSDTPQLAALKLEYPC